MELILKKWKSEYKAETDPDRKYWIHKNIEVIEKRIKRYEEVNKDPDQLQTER